jgi:hypothetical protein
MIGGPILFDGTQGLNERLQDGFHIADNRNVGPDVLADVRWINVDVNDRLRIFGKGIQTAGDPIIEPGTDGKDQVRFTHGHVGPIGAMHPQHTHGERVAFRKRAQAQERGSHRGLQQFRKREQFGGGIGTHGAAADVQHRSFGLCQRLGRSPNLTGMPHIGRRVTSQFHLARIRKFGLQLAHILGNVDQHRSRLARLGDIERLLDGAS